MHVHFAHANGIPGASYQPIIARLNPHSGFAMPMLGHNPAYPYTHNWRFLVDELIAYIEAHADEPVVGVGHSLGSIVTFMASCKKPALFKGVLMLDPPLFWGPMAWMFKLIKLTGKSDAITPAGKSKGRRQAWENRVKAVDYFASKKLFQFHPECFEAFCNAAIEQTVGEEVQLAFHVDVEVGIFRNTPDNLGSCKLPRNVTYKLIHAVQSDACRESMAIPFCRHFGIPMQQISGAHMFPLQNPDLAAELIRTFIVECQ